MTAAAEIAMAYQQQRHQQREALPLDMWQAAAADDVEGLRGLVGATEEEGKEMGNPVDLRDDSGRTALHVAASHGSEKAVRFLLGRHADPNAADAESGWTALHRALYAGNLRIALLLLRTGAVLGDELTPWRPTAQPQPAHGGRHGPKNAGADHDGLTPLALASWLRRGQLRQARAEGRGGDVLSFGKGLDFQLGYPASDKHGRGDDVPKPRRIEALADVEVVDAAAARYHSIVLAADGKVFSWGQGRGGRLGHGDENPQLFPRLVEPLLGLKVIKVAAAENHTACITAEGGVYCWGSDRYGQLGQGGSSAAQQLAASPSTSGGAFSASYSLRPRAVQSLKKVPVVDIACGASHTAAVSFDGRVFTWGGNAHKQLGHEAVGPTGDGIPRMVTLLYHRRNEKKDPRRAIQVSAGCNNTLVVVESPFYGHVKQPNKIFEWGNGSAVPRRVDFRPAEQARHQVLQRGRPGGSGGRRQRPNSNAGASLWALGSRGGVDGDGSGTGRINIVQVAAGQNHNVARCADGSVYVWGLGEALGPEVQSGYAAHPRAVEGLGANRAVHVSASANRTCVVTETGDLWSWGAAREQGVLGHGLHNWMPVPKRVVGLKRAVKVAAGPEHTLCLLSASAPPLPHPHLAPPPSAAAVDREEDSDEGWASSSRATSPGSDAPAEVFEMDDDVPPQHQQLQEDEGAGSFAGPNVAEALMGAEAAARPNNKRAASPGPQDLAVVPSLKELCERNIAQQVDMRNAVSVLAHAEALDARALADYCVEYVSRNMDGILVAGRPADLDYLLEEAADDVSELLAACARVEEESGDALSGSGLLGGSGGPGNGSDGRQSAVAVMLARAQRGQDPPLEDALKLERGVKKKLAQCEELQKRLDDASSPAAEGAGAGAVLSPDQLRKLGRRASLEAELQALQPLIQRLRVVEKAKGVREQRQQQEEAEAAAAAAAATAAAAVESKPGEGEGDEEEKKPALSFLCEACGVKCASEAAWAEHLRGRRHAKRVQRLEEERAEQELQRREAEAARRQREMWPRGTPLPPPPPGSSPWGAGLEASSSVSVAPVTPSPHRPVPPPSQQQALSSSAGAGNKKSFRQLMEEEAALAAARKGPGASASYSSLAGSYNSSSTTPLGGSYYGRSPAAASPFLVGSPSQPQQHAARRPSLSSSHGSLGTSAGAGFGGRSLEDREGGGVPLAAFIKGGSSPFTPAKPAPALSSSSCWASATKQQQTPDAAAAAAAQAAEAFATAAAAAAAATEASSFESIMAEEERKAQQQRFFTGNNCPWFTERRARSDSFDVIQEQQRLEQRLKEEEESRALAEALAVAAAEEEKELLREMAKARQQQRRKKSVGGAAEAGVAGGAGGEQQQPKKKGGGGRGGGKKQAAVKSATDVVAPSECEATAQQHHEGKKGGSRGPRSGGKKGGGGGSGGGEGRRRSASSGGGGRERARSVAGAPAVAPVS